MDAVPQPDSDNCDARRSASPLTDVAWRLHARLCGALGRSKTDPAGATAIEYGLIAAGIAVAIIPAIDLLGLEVGKVFNTIKIEFEAAPPDAPPPEPGPGRR